VRKILIQPQDESLQ